MTDVRKVIKRIRGIPTKPLEVTDPVDVRLAEARGEMRMDEIRESQVRIIRDRNFQKAREAREQMLEEARIEKERQDEISRERLKNLAKGRRKLERMRNEA